MSARFQIMTYLGTFLGGCLKSKFKRLLSDKEGVVREEKRGKDMQIKREREGAACSKMRLH